jgi:hypothetical protein
VGVGALDDALDVTRMPCACVTGSRWGLGARRGVRPGERRAGAGRWVGTGGAWLGNLPCYPIGGEALGWVYWVGAGAADTTRPDLPPERRAEGG